MISWHYYEIENDEFCVVRSMKSMNWYSWRCGRLAWVSGGGRGWAVDDKDGSWRPIFAGRLWYLARPR
jgi:hypothetical protein